MITSLFSLVKQADKLNDDIQLLEKLDEAQNKRVKVKSLALITSPKGLSTIFAVGLARGLIKPSIVRQLKSMAVIYGKTNLDDWLTGEEIQDLE